MSSFDNHSNFAISTILPGSSIINTLTGSGIIINNADRASFPTPPFNAVICPAATNPTSTNAEIVRIMSFDGNETYYCQRNAEVGGSLLNTITAGYQIFDAITAKTFTDIETQSALLASSNTFTGNNTFNNSIVVNGGFTQAISNKISAYNITSTDSVILADATSGTFAITMPTAVGITGRTYTVKRINSNLNPIAVSGTLSQTIDGSTGYSLLNPNEAITLISDGSNWRII